MQLKHHILMVATLVGLTSVAFAKTINLYDQPKADSKVAGTIDLAKGIVPIFTPKDSQWVKVGDPSNGNVGWVKASDLNANESSVTMTQEIVNNGQGPKSYTILKFNEPSTLTPEQIKEMQRRQQIMQKAIQDMSNSVHKYFQETWHMPVTFPVVMPVFVPPPAQHSQP